MLLEFKTKNFKSFVDETTFSMLAAPKQKGLDYSLFAVKNSRTSKGLCSSVIYGPNAAGKTNIICAMDVLKSILLRGHIRNALSVESSRNPATVALELIPNNSFDEPIPVCFGIDFLEEDYRIQYELQLDLGTFLDADYESKRTVLQEKLLINGKSVFNRKSLEIDNLDFPEDTSIHLAKDNADTMRQIAENSLNPQELFLTNGFKSIYSPKIADLILKWFTEKFMVFYRTDSMQFMGHLVNLKENTVYVEKTYNEAAKLFGISSNALGHIVDREDSKPKLYSIFKGKNKAVLAEIFESYGTIRFINMFPLVIRALLKGGTLVVDEFDASIHPMALMSIINIFHNDEINKNHAQLIFNTHNPIFLNSNLFRRDEIKFVERDEKTQKSILYSLSDFGTSGKDGVRKNEDYMKNYFISRYGAIRNIDFTPIFEKEPQSEHAEAAYNDTPKT